MKKLIASPDWVYFPDLAGAVVLLRVAESEEAIAIWVTHEVADSLLAIMARKPGSEEKIDLSWAKEILSENDLPLVKSEILDYQEGIFAAYLVFSRAEVEIRKACLVSQAIALALLADLPILVSSEVLERSAIAFNGDFRPLSDTDISDFMAQLEKLSPEDFINAVE